MTWGNAKEFQDVLNKTTDNVEGYDLVGHAYGSFMGTHDRTFLNTDTNLSVRSEYNRADYDYFRQGESIPCKQEHRIEMCMQAYNRVALIHNAVDMMAEFATSGIRLVHPNTKINNFHKRWAEQVSFKYVSERIVNMLLRAGNAPIKSQTGKVSIKVEDEWRKTFAAEDLHHTELVKEKIVKREIPLAYSVLNPLSLEVLGGEFASFIGKPIFALKLTSGLKQTIATIVQRSSTEPHIAELANNLPSMVKDALKRGHRSIILDQNKISVLYYKKDDWLVWAEPMLSPLLSTIVMLEKMHLADISALDGAISNIRLWKLGSLEHKAIPTRDAINKLRNILASAGTGVLDLIWGPDLEMKESNTQVHKFLGPQKYQQVMAELYAGLGIPPSLTGGGGTDAGMTNNSISIRIMIERLEYVRNILVDFWNEELRKIQKAMGWRFPAKVIFDYQVLSNTDAEKKLLTELVDRDIISAETLREKFDIDNDIEKVRIKNDLRDRKKDNVPNKAGPFHDAEWEVELKKILLQGGSVAPSQLGLELLPKKDGEDNSLELQAKLMPKPAPGTGVVPKKKPKKSNGRPVGAKDTGKRKTKTVKPRAAASFGQNFIWALNAQQAIADAVTPGILKSYNKKNVRSLTKEEGELLEYVKFSTLCAFKPGDEVSLDAIANVLDTKPQPPADVTAMLKVLVYRFTQAQNKKPSIDDMRQLQATALILTHEEVEDE